MFKCKYPPGIYGFIHVSIMNNWLDIVNDQLNLIHETGLYDKCKKVFACVLGPKSVDCSFIEDQGVEILARDEDLTLGDVYGLRQLHAFTKQNINHSKLWFIHTKGVSRPHCFNSYCWRKYMEYFVIEQHRDCIEALNNNDCCGCQWVDYGWKRGYVGNFWWANSDYIKRLPKDVLIGENWNHPFAVGIRWAAEFNFIGRGEPRVVNLHHTKHCLYDFPYTKNFYIKSPKFA